MGYPVCLVEIHGEAQSWELGGMVDPARPHGNAPSGDLLACRTDKRLSMDTPAGVFEITLAAVRDRNGLTWKDKIHPQDVVVIQMMNYQGRVGARGEGELHTVMIGFVDRVTETVALNARGVPQHVIQVRGRDVGKLFLHGVVTYWTFLGASLLKMQEFIDASLLNAKPDEVIERLLDRIYKQFLQITLTVLGRQRDFWDCLAYRLESYGAEVPAGLDFQFLAGEGSFWSFFVKVASSPFHELWVDTRRISSLGGGSEVTAQDAQFVLGKDGSAPTLFLRPTPFPYLTPPPALPTDVPAATPPLPGIDVAVPETIVRPSGRVRAEAWTALVRHQVGGEDLNLEPFDQVLSVSDEEQANFYLVSPQYAWIGEKHWLLSVPGIIDEPKFRRYGYRPMLPATSLIQPKAIDTLQDPIVQFYTALNWRMASWNVLNDQFLSGIKTFKLLPHIHVGERLLDRSNWQKPYEFYIEQVSHHFVQHEQATTTLGLTRGLPAREYETYGGKLTGARTYLKIA